MSSERGAQRRLRLLSYVLPALVLAACLSLSWYQWNRERLDLERVMQEDFDTRVREAVGIFKERMLACEQVLHAMAGLYAASVSVERGEFNAFAGALNIAAHPGLQAVGFIAALPDARKARQIGAARRDGAGDFTVFPSGTRADYGPVLYAEPPNVLLAIPGSDQLAQPARREAMLLARDSGGAAISNKIRLPEERAEDVEAGFRMVLPVYRNGAPHGSVEQRRAALVGWAYAAFSMDGLLDNILGERPNIALEVFDGGEALDDEPLADTQRDRVGGESALRLFFASRRVDIGGYAWTVTARSLPNFTTPIALSKLRLIADIGVAASVLAAFATWLLMRRRIRNLRHATELRAAKENAEAANLSKSRFLAAASHDLRQPTHALGLFIATLRSMARRPEVKGADVEKIATRLQLALDGLGRLLNGLLDVSRLEAGAAEVHRRPVPVQAVLAEIANAFAGPAREKGLALRVAPTSLWVDTDPVVLGRVLSNLAANALRYTEHGRILIGCRRRPGVVEIQVLDTGIGIAPDQRARIFEEFYQVGNVARDREQGLGLGLAIVQRSVDLLGGTVAVASEPGRGSRFSVALPRADAARGAPGAEPGAAAEGGAGRVILVIDDNAEVLDSMRALLGEWGHTAIAVRTLEAALDAAARDAEIGLVIADYRLGDSVTGADAIDAVRRALGRAVPAVIITGDTSPQRIREANRSGHRLLHKPIDPRELEALINA